MDLQKFVAPVLQALPTVAGLFGVGLTGVLHPVLEKFFVLLEQKELAEDSIGLKWTKRW